ncbi:MAG TPA: SMR family transporter [Planctomycetota bacterium]|nr:SMR family transporter [Planctomycetota bacterium]
MRYFFLVFALVMNAGASVLLKIGSKLAERTPLDAGAGLVEKSLHFLNVPTVVAIVLFAVNVLAYRRALDEFNLSVAYPIMVSGGLVLVTASAWLIPMLSERVRWWQIAGIVLIALGIWLLTWQPRGSAKTADDADAARPVGTGSSRA